MKQFGLVQLQSRCQLMLNLVRSGNMEMTDELKREANILCFYLIKRLQGNHITASKDVQKRHGVSEDGIKALIEKFRI